MMSFWPALITAIAALVLAAIAVFFIAGPQRIWRMAGPPDLGPVAWETFERRTTPNDALACPLRLCAAKSDLTPPIFTVSPERLRAVFGRVIASESSIEKVGADEAALTERYIQRTPLMGFPDTINVRFLDLGERRSTLALYSRSQLGRSDLGANRARIERWLDKLGKEASSAKAP